MVFAAKNEDGSPLAGEASSLSMKVRTRLALGTARVSWLGAHPCCTVRSAWRSGCRPTAASALLRLGAVCTVQNILACALRAPRKVPCAKRSALVLTPVNVLQNLGSEVAVKVDGKELEKDSETSIGPGTKIAFGEDAIFLARPSLVCVLQSHVARCKELSTCAVALRRVCLLQVERNAFAHA